MSSYKCRFCGGICNKKEAPIVCLLPDETNQCAIQTGTFAKSTTQKAPKMFRIVKFVLSSLQELGIERVKDCRVMWGINTMQMTVNFNHGELHLELKVLFVAAYGSYACNISLLNFHGVENMREDVICEPTNDFSWSITQIQEHLKELLII